MGATVIGLLLLLLAADAEEFAAERALLERFARAQEKVDRFRAGFRQERISALSRKPLVSSGVLYYRRDAQCLLFRTEKPGRVDLRIDATTYQVYRPEAGKAERFVFRDVSPGEVLLQAFGARVKELRAAFSVTGSKREKEFLRITLQPKTKALKRYVPALDLQFHEKRATLKSVRYTNHDGETITIELSSVDVEAEVSKELFAKDPPKGTKLRVIEVKAEP